MIGSVGAEVEDGAAGADNNDNIILGDRVEFLERELVSTPHHAHFESRVAGNC